MLLNLKKYLAIRASCNFQFNLHYFNKYILYPLALGLLCTHTHTWRFGNNKCNIYESFGIHTLAAGLSSQNSMCIYFNLTLPRVFVAPWIGNSCVYVYRWKNLISFSNFPAKNQFLVPSYTSSHVITHYHRWLLSVPIQFTHFTLRLIYMCLL